MLRSLIFNLLFYPGSVLYATIMLPCLVTRRATHWGIHLWVYGVLWLVRVILKLDYRVLLDEKLPQQACIYASKHQSAWETIALWVLVPNPVFVMKRELYALPAIGWWIRRAGNIALDRKAGMGAVKQLIREAQQRLSEGYNIIIFPEGTRVLPGAQAEYLPGIAALYKYAGVPVVPVALDSGSFWPRNAWRKRPGVITVRMLAAFPAGREVKGMLAELQTAIETACAKLPAA